MRNCKPVVILKPGWGNEGRWQLKRQSSFLNGPLQPSADSEPLDLHSIHLLNWGQCCASASRGWHWLQAAQSLGENVIKHSFYHTSNCVLTVLSGMKELLCKQNEQYALSGYSTEVSPISWIERMLLNNSNSYCSLIFFRKLTEHKSLHIIFEGTTSVWVH